MAGLYLPLVRRSQYSLAGTFHRRRSRLLKTGFFRQVRELKIRRKNPGSALWTDDVQFGIVQPRNAQVVDSRAMATKAMAVNLVAHSWMPSCPGLNWQKFFSGPLHWWDSSRRLEKVGKCNMLMKVVLLSVFL